MLVIYLTFSAGVVVVLGFHTSFVVVGNQIRVILVNIKVVQAKLIKLFVKQQMLVRVQGHP